MAVMDDLRLVAEKEGYVQGTVQFERRLRQLKVITCRDMRGLSTCSSCSYYVECKLIQEVARDKNASKAEKEENKKPT